MITCMVWGERIPHACAKSQTLLRSIFDILALDRHIENQSIPWDKSDKTKNK